MTPEQIKDARALVERLDMFTPGPWVRDCWDILGKAPGTGIVAEICRPGELDSEFWKIGEPDNNARLIAAAPDLHAALTAALAEIERLETQIRSLDHALNFILSDAAWTPKHPACESIIARINALRKGDDQ